MKRTALLDAAESLLIGQGTRALTLAAVAERAGFSKGGLLYHFNTKEALLRALIERLIAEFDDAVDARCDSTVPGDYTRAYVEVIFDLVGADAPRGGQRRWAVVTAAANDLDMIEPLRVAFRRWHARPDGPDEIASQLARLAAEGVWEVCQMAPGTYTDARLTEIRERILASI